MPLSDLVDEIFEQEAGVCRASACFRVKLDTENWLRLMDDTLIGKVIGVNEELNSSDN